MIVDVLLTKIIVSITHALSAFLLSIRFYLHFPSAIIDWIFVPNGEDNISLFVSEMLFFNHDFLFLFETMQLIVKG